MTGRSRRALEAVIKSGGSSDYSGEKDGLSQGVPVAVKLRIVHGVTKAGAKPQRGLFVTHRSDTLCSCVSRQHCPTPRDLQTDLPCSEFLL